MTYVLGDPQGPSTVSPGDRLVDGQNGASIQCSVLGNGPYTVSGTIRAQTYQGDQVTFILTDGVINADKQTGTASVSVNTPQLASTFSGTDCTLVVVGANVKPGALWATLACPSISSPSTAQTCGVGSFSTVVFENCSGS